MPAEIAYTVEGRWPFPLDMLRYDQASAATDADQEMIDRLAQEHAPDRAAFNKVAIRLVGPNRPKTARWESFGWAVPGDVEHRLIKEARERDARNATLLASAMEKLTDDERCAVQAVIDGPGAHV